MTTQRLALCFLVTFTIVHEGWSCPQTWLRFGNSCFKLVETHNTWADAAKVCERLGGYLAEIDSEMEAVFIKTLLEGKKLDPPFVWLGGNDLLLEGYWQWAKSNQLVDYSDWCQGEPNNMVNEDCMALTSHQCDWKWFDEPCTATYSSLCELKYTSKPLIG